MRRLMKEAGLPEPEFENKGFFTVRFTKRTKFQSATGDPLNNFSETEMAVIKVIRDNPGIRKTGIVPMVNNSDATIKRIIKILVEKDLIEYRGSKKTVGYFLLTQS